MQLVNPNYPTKNWSQTDKEFSRKVVIIVYPLHHCNDTVPPQQQIQNTSNFCLLLPLFVLYITRFYLLFKYFVSHQIFSKIFHGSIETLRLPLLLNALSLKKIYEIGANKKSKFEDIYILKNWKKFINSNYVRWNI